ncbi:MAG TPA: cobyric acid synthase CobQ, partial [Burkholderiaceae bacterium]|nr:cobyric acid synthase CobQ [Burkholderiaceae bacterium]
SIAVLAAPHISNLDEFETLRRLPRVRLTWARDAATVQDADWLILPGSKHTRADLDWLRVSGLAEAVRAHANAGKPLLAICGGLQMLGVSIDDSEGVEGGSPGCSEGMGLLPLRTALGGDKTLRRMEVRFAVLGGVWSALSGLRADAYEIRFGRSWLADEAACGDSCREALSPQMGWQRDNVLAIYVHGLFENEHVLQALFGHVPRTSDDAFDRLARQLDESFAPGTLQGLLRPDERHAS